MPLFFLLAGLVLVVTGVNGTTSDAGRLLKGDFTGPNNFLVWFFAILIAGAFGYIPKFKPISYAFLTLIFVVIILANQKGKSYGLFTRLREAIEELSTGAGIDSQDATGSGGNGLFDSALKLGGNYAKREALNYFGDVTHNI